MADEKRDVVANVHYGGDYRHELERARETGECIFCAERFRALELFRERDWFLVPNQYPAKDREDQPAAFHLLFVSREHRDDTAPLAARDWAQIEVLRSWADSKFGITGGCLFLRVGKAEVCGRTVRHPHVHYYVPRMVPDRSGGLRPVPIDIAVG